MILERPQQPRAAASLRLWAQIMSGDLCQTLIVSKLSRETLAKKIDLGAVSPERSFADGTTGRRLKARFVQTESGGIDLSTITLILNDILLPVFPQRSDAVERLSRGRQPSRILMTSSCGMG